MSKPRPCPCHSERPYAACCEPYHKGEQEAPDAEALMRSRFSGFALGQVKYLHRTLHPRHPDRARPEAEVLREMREASETFKYMGLLVLDRREPDAHGVAQVLFAAKIFERGRDRSFIERSDFLHDGTGWRYVSGDIVPRAALKTDVRALTIETFRALTGP